MTTFTVNYRDISEIDNEVVNALHHAKVGGISTNVLVDHVSAEYTESGLNTFTIYVDDRCDDWYNLHCYDDVSENVAINRCNMWLEAFVASAVRARQLMNTSSNRPEFMGMQLELPLG